MNIRDLLRDIALEGTGVSITLRRRASERTHLERLKVRESFGAVKWSDHVINGVQARTCAGTLVTHRPFNTWLKARRNRSNRSTYSAR